MSLNYELSKIPESVRTVRATHDDPANDIKAGDLIMNPVTRSLIWATVSVGIGEITEANAAEFYGRVSMAEKLFGASRKDRPLTLQDVRDHIGLRTNVFPKEKQASWLKRVFAAHMRESVAAHNRSSAQTENGAAPSN